MATYYWVSDGTTKTGFYSDSNHWSLTSNGPGGAGVPTSTDDVIFNASSGAATDICYIYGGDACRNITANASGTAIHLEITEIAIHGNVAIGASVVFDSFGGQISHYVNPGTTNTINYGNKVVPCYFYFDIINYAGTTGTFTMASGVTATLGFYIYSGTFNTANNAINTSDFFIGTLSDSGPIVFNAGSSTITLTNLAETSGYTNIPPQWILDPDPSFSGYTVTYNTGTSVISMGSNTVATQLNDVKRFYGGGKTYNRLNLLGTYCDIHDANTFGILSVIIPATTLTVSPYTVAVLTLDSNQTVTSNYSVSGNAAIQRLTVTSDFLGVARTITIPATRTSNNVDYRDITISGTALSGTSLGNLLGCTNITFTAAVTRYARNVQANFSSTNSWATTSGGAAGASVPLPQDTIIFDSNSDRIYADMLYIGGALNVTNTYPYSSLYVPAGPSNYSIFGLITISPSQPFLNDFFQGNEIVQLCNRTSRNFELTKTYGDIWIVAPGATITLTSSLTASGDFGHYAITLRAGTLNTNNQSIEANRIQTIYYDGITFSNGMALNLSNSVISLINPSSGVEALFLSFDSSSLIFTFNAGTSTIRCINYFTQGNNRNTFIATSFNWTFYNVYFGCLSPSQFMRVRISSQSSQTNQTFNSIGIDPLYPSAVMISMNGRSSGSCITTSNIENTAASSGRTLLFANDEVPNSGPSFGYFQGQINITNLTPITLNYVAFKNINITSTEEVIAYGVVNLGTVSGNKLVLASPVAIAAFNTTGNYSITMPANYAGSMAVMVVGGGSAGSSASIGRGGFGGGGAATSFSSNFAVTAGQTLYINVGAGGVNGGSGGPSWLNTSSNIDPTNVINGIRANSGGISVGGNYTAFAMVSLRGGNGGSGNTSNGSGLGGGGGGAANSFTTQFSNLVIKGGNSSGTNGRGGAGGGGVTGAGVNNTSQNGSAGGTGYTTAGGAGGVPTAGNGGAGSGGSGGGGGAFSSSAGVPGGNGGSGTSIAGDIIAWFTNGVTGYTIAGTGGGGGGGAANTSTSAVPGTVGGNGGNGGIGSGGGGGGGCPAAFGLNGTMGSGGNGLVILMYSTYIPVTYATILGED